MSMEDKSKETCFALDCEMCYTTRGIELTRITVVDDDGNTTYETFVKPDNKIIDYNTKYDNHQFQIHEQNMSLNLPTYFLGSVV